MADSSSKEPSWINPLVAAGVLIGLVAGIVAVVAVAPDWAKVPELIAGLVVIALTVLIYRSRGPLRLVMALLAGATAVAMVIVPVVPTSWQTRSCGVSAGGGGVNGTWGPLRQEYTVANPAPYPVLNSITDNPNFGDERDFFGVLPELQNTTWCRSLAAKDGDILRFRIYVNNAAADNLGRAAAARGVTALVTMSQERATLQSLLGTLSSTNTNPKQVWGRVEVSSDRPFRLDLVEGSPRVYSNAARDNQPTTGSGRQIGDPFDGLALGYNADNGIILPGYQYALYVVFTMRVTHVG